MKIRRSNETATCLLLDSGSILLARGTHKTLEDSGLVEVKIFDGDAKDVADSTIVQLLSIQKDGPTRLCQVKGYRGDILTLEPLRTLDEQVRRNLRIPVVFDSYAYPLYPVKGGKVPIKSSDLSCGGISFYTEREFMRGEQFEVIIPITSVGPLILKCQVLRLCDKRDNLYLYAAKFIDMINDEETKVRETVFSVQLQGKN